MPFFLSYVEYGTSGDSHSAFILSEQKNPSEPSSILQEIGFVFDNSKRSNFQQLFHCISPSARRGRLKTNEEIASKILHRSYIGGHITYEISESEKNNFLACISRDKDSPPDYRVYRHNCKTYALNLFKEIGIVDIDRVRNIAVQIPNLNNKLLNPLDKKLFCNPERKNELTALDATVKEFIKTCDKITPILKKYDKDNNTKKYSRLIKKITKLSEFQKKILEMNNNELQELSNIAKDLLESVQMITISFNSESQENYKNLIQLLKDIPKSHQKILNLQTAWASTPPLTRRINLSHFNNHEKALYLVKIKYDETSQCLNSLIEYLDSEDTKTTDLKLKDDISNLKIYINVARTSLNELNEKFYNDSSDHKSIDIEKNCLQQVRTINQHISKLQKNIHNYMPNANVECSFLTKVINSLLNYVKKDYGSIHMRLKDKVYGKINDATLSTNKYIASKR